jgi:hypothetical protein
MIMMPKDTSSSGPYDAPGANCEESATPSPIGRADLPAVGALVVLWALMAIVVDPVGDFPLNDDWAYGLPVKWLVENGRLRFTDQGAMTLITQVFWGALFASIAGFTFTVLRVSTLVIATVGLAASYLVGREVGLPRWLAMVVTGLFVVNPVFISLSHTFLTDVHFWSLTMLAVFLLLRGVRRGHAVSYWAGWAVILAATLIRQVGLAIPIGLVVALALKDGFGRSWLVSVLVPTLALFAVVLAYPKVVQSTIGLSAAYAYSQNSLGLIFVDLMHLRLGALKPFLYAVGCGLMHLGWWMLPLLVLLPSFPGASDRPGKVVLTPFIAVGSAAVVTALLWATGGLMPVGSPGCILVDLGTGPQTMVGEPPHAPVLFWVAVTAVSAFGAALLVLALASTARRSFAQLLSSRNHRPLWLPAFLIMVGTVYWLPFGYYGPWFDRYLLLEMSLLGLLIAGEATRSAGRGLRPSAPRLAAAAALALVYLGFGIVSAHDYLAWNRARWAAVRSLMKAQDIAPTDINGGFEFDKYFYWENRLGGASGTASGVPGVHSPGSEIGSRPRLALGFSEAPQFTLVRRLPVDRWMLFSPGQVDILGLDPH